MYQIGDRVVYAMHGVCEVADLEERIVDRKKVHYLVLSPVGQQGARYLVPTHNAVAMAKVRPMLTSQELSALLSDSLLREDVWIRDENQRKQHYRLLIGSADRIRLLQMVATLYRHKEEQLAAGRKVHLCDENFLRDAEKLLVEEIALVLDMEPQQARDYLRITLRNQ